MNFQQNSLRIFIKICYIFSKYVTTVNIFYINCMYFYKKLKNFLTFNIFPENKLENASNSRLNKEKLCKKRKRKIKAHKL